MHIHTCVRLAHAYPYMLILTSSADGLKKDCAANQVQHKILQTRGSTRFHKLYI